MINVFVYDNSDAAGRQLVVHSIGHTATDYCLIISALVQSFTAYLLGLEQQHQDKLFADAQYGDGEYKITVIVTDSTDQTVLDKLTGATEMLKTGVANYAEEFSEGIIFNDSIYLSDYLAWAVDNQTGQELLRVENRGA